MVSTVSKQKLYPTRIDSNSRFAREGSWAFESNPSRNTRLENPNQAGALECQGDELLSATSVV